MNVTGIGIVLLISKVAAVYGVSLGVTSGLQYYHDFKLTKKKRTGGGKNHGKGDFESKITQLRSELSQPE